MVNQGDKITQYVVYQHYKDNKMEVARYNNLADAESEAQRQRDSDCGLAWYNVKPEIKDFMQRADKIVKDLKGYGQAFHYAVHYEGHKTIVIQGNYLIERLEEILPELKELVSYMENK